MGEISSMDTLQGVLYDLVDGILSIFLQDIEGVSFCYVTPQKHAKWVLSENWIKIGRSM